MFHPKKQSISSSRVFYALFLFLLIFTAASRMANAQVPPYHALSPNGSYYCGGCDGGYNIGGNGSTGAGDTLITGQSSTVYVFTIPLSVAPIVINPLQDGTDEIMCPNGGWASATAVGSGTVEQLSGVNATGTGCAIQTAMYSGGTLYWSYNYPLGASVYITNPFNGETTQDFYAWSVAAYDLSATTSYRFDVYYSQFGGSITYHDTDGTGQYPQSTSTITDTIQKTQPLLYPPATSTAWTAYATLSNFYTGEVIASSSAIVFGIIPISGETSSTLGTFTTNCSFTSSSFLADPIGNIQTGICSALVFLFIPNSAQQSDILSRFNVIKTQVSTKPPFGYFNSIYNSFQSFQEGTSGVQLIDASGSAAMSPVFGSLDTGISVVVWALFGFWIFHRARLIEL